MKGIICAEKSFSDSNEDNTKINSQLYCEYFNYLVWMVNGRINNESLKGYYLWATLSGFELMFAWKGH